MIIKSADFVTSNTDPGKCPKDNKPEYAFIGRSNVGKSSLLNKILNRKSLARTSSMPGKTVTVNFFRGDGVKFVDLPGYGYAKVAYSEKQRWADMMEGYFTSGRRINLVVQLIDIRHKPTAEDYEMLAFLKESKINFVIALTKCDKLNKTERLKRAQELEEELFGFTENKKIPFSSATGEGVEEIKSIISDALSLY